MSTLNPSAPEFYPSVTPILTNGYKAVASGIQASNKLRKRKYPDTNDARYNVTEIYLKLTNHLLKISNKFLKAGTNSIRIKNCKDDENIDKITEANDSILDIVNLEISSPSVLPSTSKESTNITAQANQRTISSWNTRPVITTTELGSTTLLAGKNIVRPQLRFKDAIDNSENIFLPKLKDKPNAKQPFMLRILYDENNIPIGYEHPYGYELASYRVPETFLTPSPLPLTFPRTLKETAYKYIDTEVEFDNLIEILKKVTEIAVDLEHHSYRTYLGLTCLIQISTKNQDFILDTLALREHVQRLNVIFTNPNILKIFHGAFNDILWLQRDFNVYVVGLFDTHCAARALHLPELSLKFLLKHYCNIEIDKKYQLADWRIRPLPMELVEYARMDTHYLIYIWHSMKNDLLKVVNDSTRCLSAVFEESREICRSKYEKEVITETSYQKLCNQYNRKFNAAQSQCLMRLYKWRDEIARQEDESTGYVLSNHYLLNLANNMPAEIEGIFGCCNNMVPPLVKQNIQMVHRIIQLCRGIPVPPTLYTVPSQIANLLNAQELEPVPVDETHLPDFRNDCPTVANKKLKLDGNNFNTLKSSKRPVTSRYTKMEMQSALAKQFIPPFERYRKYRSLAQIEELREYLEQEAKYKAAQQIKKEI